MAIFSAIAYGIGYAVGFLGAAAGLSTTTILSLASVATNVIGSVALNMVARALAPKPNIPTSEVQAIINQTDAPRRVSSHAQDSPKIPAPITVIRLATAALPRH